MGLNKSQLEIMAQRRSLVAQLRTRGRSDGRKIAKMLADAGHVNPDNGAAWSHVTIYEDIKVLDAMWLASMQGETEGHKAGVLEEIRETRRACWSKQDYGGVYTGLRQERELLGLDAPKRLNVSFVEQEAALLSEATGVPVIDIMAEFNAIADAVRAKG